MVNVKPGNRRDRAATGSPRSGGLVVPPRPGSPGDPASLPPVPRTGGSVQEADARERGKGPGAALLLLVLPVLCCGGPLIIAALASASAVTLGVAGGGLGVVLLAAAVVWLWLRQRRRAALRCCSPAPRAWPR